MIDIPKARPGDPESIDAETAARWNLLSRATKGQFEEKWESYIAAAKEAYGKSFKTAPWTTLLRLRQLCELREAKGAGAVLILLEEAETGPWRGIRARYYRGPDLRPQEPQPRCWCPNIPRREGIADIIGARNYHWRVERSGDLASDIIEDCPTWGAEPPEEAG